MDGQFYVADVEATRALGAKMAQELRLGDIVFLQGDLGAGKTSLVQGIAMGLGVHGVVKSPTFTYLWRYPLTEGWLFHYDWYRISSLDDLVNIGFFEQLAEPSITLIEWPEQVPEAVQPTWIVSIAEQAPGRVVQITKQ